MEMDFRNEARFAKRCGEIFKNNNQVSAPKIFDEFTRDRLIVMSFEEGTPVTFTDKLKEQGFNFNKLSHLISDTFNHMLFREGFVHSDPHPGNMFVRRNAQGEVELVLLDHGIYADLSDELRINYASLWRGMLMQDE